MVTFDKQTNNSRNIIPCFKSELTLGYVNDFTVLLNDQLLLASIRKTKQEALYDIDKKQFILDFIGCDPHLNDKITTLEAIDLTLREILLSIPKEVRANAYQLALEGRYQYEKIVLRPALVTALLLNTEDIELKDLELLLSRSDTHVLAMLGFPQNLSKTFRRIVPSSLNKETLNRLKHSLEHNSHIAKRFSFIKRINAGVLAMVCDAEVERMVTDRLLNEVGFDNSEDREASLITLIRKTLTLREEIQSFDSVSQVRRTYQNSIRKAKTGIMREQIQFRPLLTGNEMVTPLNDAKSIRETGEQFENCLNSDNVKDYLKQVAIDQDLYIYKVEIAKTFEGVFSIKRNKKGFWVVDEFEFDKLFTTDMVHEELRVIVNHWLADRQDISVSDVCEQ